MPGKSLCRQIIFFAAEKGLRTSCACSQGRPEMDPTDRERPFFVSGGADLHGTSANL